MSKLGLFALIAFSLLVGSAGVSAHDGEDHSRENKRFRASATSCTVITTKLDKKIAHFDKRSAKHQTVYTNLQTKLNALVDKYETAGLNTENLVADLTTLQTKIDKFSADRVLYRAKLVELKALDCSDMTVFQTKLVEARALQGTLRSDARDIKKFFKSDVKAELNSLKSQFEALNV